MLIQKISQAPWDAIPNDLSTKTMAQVQTDFRKGLAKLNAAVRNVGTIQAAFKGEAANFKPDPKLQQQRTQAAKGYHDITKAIRRFIPDFPGGQAAVDKLATETLGLKAGRKEGDNFHDYPSMEQAIIGMLAHAKNQSTGESGDTEPDSLEYEPSLWDKIKSAVASWKDEVAADREGIKSLQEGATSSQKRVLTKMVLEQLKGRSKKQP